MNIIGDVPASITYPLGVGSVVTRIVEAGTGPRVVLYMHGAGSRADRFRHNMLPLAAAGYRVIAVDFPGHGFASKGGNLQYTTPALADFVGEMLRTLGIERSILAGTSLGAHVAAELTCRNPGSVEALVLIGAIGIVEYTPKGGPPSPTPLYDASEEGIRRKFGFVVHDPRLITDDWVREEARFNSSPGAREALEAVGAYLNTGVNRDLVGARLVDSIDAIPVLLVWGAQDLWVPSEVGHRVAELLPSAQLHLMEGTGHAPYFEDPDTFNTLLTSFLTASPQHATSSG
ncbi:MAG: alpha/beta fold hydrolase [Candidatus Dormiibacterota bacterium]